MWELSTFGNVRRNGEHYEPTIKTFKGMPRRIFCGPIFVYRAVAQLFIPNPENKPTVDHIDRNSLNDRVDNLRWCTMKEQCQNRNNEAISESFKRISLLEEVRKKRSVSMKKYWARRKSQA